MSLPRTLATTRRVLTQLRRDPRTIAMLLVVPLVLLWLLELVFDGQPGTFDRIGRRCSRCSRSSSCSSSRR